MGEGETHPRHTPPNEDIEVVEGAGPHAHQNLSRFRHWPLDFHNLENLRATMLTNQGSVHGAHVVATCRPLPGLLIRPPATAASRSAEFMVILPSRTSRETEVRTTRAVLFAAT